MLLHEPKFQIGDRLRDHDEFITIIGISPHPDSNNEYSYFCVTDESGYSTFVAYEESYLEDFKLLTKRELPTER